MISQRNQKIYELRQTGLTYEKIGKHFNISKARASQIYYKTKYLKRRKKHWTDALHPQSVRINNALRNNDIKTEEQAIDAIQSGTLDPVKTHNYGRVSHHILCDYLGINPYCHTIRELKKQRAKMCRRINMQIKMLENQK